jgi:hypothetical protein
MSAKVFDKINAVNLLDRVEHHATALEGCANAMEADGVGTDIHSGHVVHLRKMAAQLRSEGAQGRLASSFYASAEPKRFDAATAAILDQLR